MTQKLAPEVIERMQPLWAVADEVLRSGLGLLIEVARQCNGDKTILSTVEFERAGRDLPMRHAARVRHRTPAARLSD